MSLTNKIIAVLFLVSHTVFSQEWIPTNITDVATIDFPVESELIENQGETIWSATDNDAVYLVIVKKLDILQASRLTPDNIPDFYEGVANGILNAANAELITKKNIRVNDFQGLEVEYLATSNPELPALRYNRIFLIDQYMVQINFWPLTDQKSISEEKRKQFFESFSIHSTKNYATPDPSNVAEEAPNALNIGEEMGYRMGQLLAGLTILGLLIGVIFLMRFFIKKQKRKNTAQQLPKQKQ